jgi:hypothetical protein
MIAPRIKAIYLIRKCIEDLSLLHVRNELIVLYLKKEICVYRRLQIAVVCGIFRRDRAAVREGSGSESETLCEEYSDRFGCCGVF